MMFSVFMATSICFVGFGTGDIPAFENGHRKIFDYGGTFKITFSNGKVLEVETTANNGIKTPSGFYVGSRVSDVINYYNRVGTPNTSDRAIGAKSTNMIRYDHKWSTNLVFEFNSNEKVTKIKILAMP